MKLCALILTVLVGCAASFFGYILPGAGTVAAIAVMGTFLLYAIEKQSKG